MSDRVYCLLCDKPSTYLQVARKLSGGRKPSQATKERVSRHIRDLRMEGTVRCVGYRDNPGYVAGTETPRWLQVWAVVRRWPRDSPSAVGTTDGSCAHHARTSIARRTARTAWTTGSATTLPSSDAPSTARATMRTSGMPARSFPASPLRGRSGRRGWGSGADGAQARRAFCGHRRTGAGPDGPRHRLHVDRVRDRRPGVQGIRRHPRTDTQSRGHPQGRASARLRPPDVQLPLPGPQHIGIAEGHVRGFGHALLPSVGGRKAPPRRCGERESRRCS